jgi:hypothetical protein
MNAICKPQVASVCHLTLAARAVQVAFTPYHSMKAVHRTLVVLVALAVLSAGECAATRCSKQGVPYKRQLSSLQCRLQQGPADCCVPQQRADTAARDKPGVMYCWLLFLVQQ